MSMTRLRMSGRVKFFNSQKGFGFIIPNTEEGIEPGLDVFVHHTTIHNDGGFKSLAEGEEVEFTLLQGPKGLQASNVTGPDGRPVRGDPAAQRAKQSGNGQGTRATAVNPAFHPLMPLYHHPFPSPFYPYPPMHQPGGPVSDEHMYAAPPFYYPPGMYQAMEHPGVEMVHESELMYGDGEDRPTVVADHITTTANPDTILDTSTENIKEKGTRDATGDAAPSTPASSIHTSPAFRRRSVNSVTPGLGFPFSSLYPMPTQAYYSRAGIMYPPPSQGDALVTGMHHHHPSQAYIPLAATDYGQPYPLNALSGKPSSGDATRPANLKPYIRAGLTAALSSPTDFPPLPHKSSTDVTIADPGQQHAMTAA